MNAQPLFDCPQCNGFGILVTLTMEAPDCPLCLGKGRVSDKTFHRRKQGEFLRSRRLARNLSLREAAKLVHMDNSNLSKMELGIIKPRAIEYPHMP